MTTGLAIFITLFTAGIITAVVVIRKKSQKATSVGKSTTVKDETTDEEKTNDKGV